METLHYLELRNFPILEQLRLEEALLRVDDRNWCLINRGSPRSIVMGISGKAEEVSFLNKVQDANIPVIKRYSGGGTVIVDSDTVFISFIANRSILPCPCYPRKVMDWSGEFYAPLLHPYPFAVRENDYVIGDHKFGGNAQSITKDRFVHHSTLLWDFSDTNMDFLQFPAKVPEYRGKRAHSDFLCRLKDYCKCQDQFVSGFLEQLGASYCLESSDVEKLRSLQEAPHRQVVTLI